MNKRNDVRLFLSVSNDAWSGANYLNSKYDDVSIINDVKTDTQGFIGITDTINQRLCACSSKSIIISFRGTESPEDWLNDLNAWHTIVPYDNYESDIRVHKGFISCYRSIRGQVLHYIATRIHKINQIYVTGHSLGGALALLCAVDIQYNYPSAHISVYTSGAPAVGNKAFAKSYNKRVPDTTRTYMRRDLVPKLPPWWFGLRLHGGYHHVMDHNPIGPISIWTGLKAFFNFGGKFMSSLTNHSISLYKTYC